MTKEQTLKFLEYLKAKQSVVVDQWREVGMFGRPVDRTPLARRVWMAIKNSQDIQTAYKKAAMAISGDRVNSLHKLFPQICYQEDLDEYLASLNMDEQQRKSYCRAAALGFYKKAVKQGKLPPLQGDLHSYLKASKFLPSRLAFCHIFFTEFHKCKLGIDAPMQLPTSIKLRAKLEFKDVPPQEITTLLVQKKLRVGYSQALAIKDWLLK